MRRLQHQKQLESEQLGREIAFLTDDLICWGPELVPIGDGFAMQSSSRAGSWDTWAWGKTGAGSRLEELKMGLMGIYCALAPVVGLGVTGSGTALPHISREKQTVTNEAQAGSRDWVATCAPVFLFLPPECHGVHQGAVRAAAHCEPEAVHPDPVLTASEQRQHTLRHPLHEGCISLPRASGEHAWCAEEGPGGIWPGRCLPLLPQHRERGDVH